MMLYFKNYSDNSNNSNMFLINSIIVLISFLTTSTFVYGQFGSYSSPICCEYDMIWKLFLVINLLTLCRLAYGELCIKCSSQTDKSCTLEPYLLSPVECPGSCFSRIIDGYTVRGCLASLEETNECMETNCVACKIGSTNHSYVCNDGVPSPDGTVHVKPRTSFSCKNRGSGYYADLETGCQIYHMCDSLGRQFSYTCPNTTLFQQRMLVCDHWYMVNCSRSENDYDANLLIGQKDKHFVEDGEYDVRTPRPDLLEQHYTGAYHIKNFKVHSAIQNAIAGIHYQKQPSQKANQFSTKDQHPLDTSTVKNVEPKFTEPGQYSTNFIRNLAGGSTTSFPTPQKPSAQPLQRRQPGEKVNDRRNIKNEGNFGINNQDLRSAGQFINSQQKLGSQVQSKSNVPITNQGNIKTPSIYFEPPLFSETNFPQNFPKFTAPSIITTTTTTTKPPTTTTTATRFITTTTTTTQKPITTIQYKPPQNNQKPNTNIPVPSRNVEPPLLIIQKPSIDYELPPFEHPSFTIFTEPTDSPLKISLTTQKLGNTKPVSGPFTTTQAPKLKPIVVADRKPFALNQGSGFIRSVAPQPEKLVLPTARILSRPINTIIESKPIKSNEILKPANDLLPPLDNFKTYDDATTQGPPIYYEWKWAVPAFDLEPPKQDSDAPTSAALISQNGKSFQKLTTNPFGNTDSADHPQSRGPTARSVPITTDGQPTTTITTKRNSFVTGQPPKTTTAVQHDIKKLQQQFSIPDYEFPLENSDEPSSFEQSESVNSFQVKIPSEIQKPNARPFFGENSKCPDCHPVFVVPGTCQPCIRTRR